MDSKLVPDEEIITAIRSSNLNPIIHLIYREFADSVIAYVVNNGGSQQDADDVFQETVVAFIDLVKAGKFRGEARIKTFLVSVARNIWLNEIKKKQSQGQRAKVFELGRGENQPEDASSNLYQREIKQQFLALMDRLGASCRRLLTLYYYENQTFKEIMEKMDYENEQVVRNKKYKCMKELTDMIRANPVIQEKIKNTY
jgi:RNA polymerase sigma factor (sigma-70 family)